MTSHSFTTLTKALGLGKSRKQTRPPTLRTSSPSHPPLFSASTDDLPRAPRSAPLTRPPLRHSKSTSNFLGRTWARSRQRSQTADHIAFSTPATMPQSPRAARLKFALERRSTASTTSSDHTTYTHHTTTTTTTHTANESVPHSPLPLQIWPHFAWNPSADDGADIGLGLDDYDDEHDNGPVFAGFFQRLRDLEAELDLIEARDGFQTLK